MGKRELLLAGAFILLGALVYQFTAPPADPSRPGFSIGRLLQGARREMQGRQESAEETRRFTIPAPPAVNEVRIGLRSVRVNVTGEDRPDIAVEYLVRSDGYDKAEAESLLKQSLLNVDQAGALVILTGFFPEAGTQTATLTLKVPKRLSIRMDEKNAPLKIDGVASVAIGVGTGESTITNVPGQVTLTQRGRIATIDNVGSVRLTASAGAEVRVTQVKDATNLVLQSAEVTASALSGSLDVESRSSTLRFEQIEKLRGSVRINASAGELVMLGLATEARIDGRRTEIRVEMAAAAPLAIYNEAEPLELVLPAVGLRIDAVARDARVSIEPGIQKAGLKTEVSGEGGPGQPREERAVGTIGGGGPLVTLRNAHADIVLRAK